MKANDLNETTAKVAGGFFLLAAITSIIALILYEPILHDIDFIVKNSVNENRVLVGVLFEIMTAFSVIGTSVTLFPFLKKYNESLALGAVCFRLLEATLIIIGILSLLTIVTMNHYFLSGADQDATYFRNAGKLLVAIHDWTFLYGPNLTLGPSTFITSYLLFKSKIAPRYITTLGLIGGPLVSLCAVLVTFGMFSQVSIWGMAFAIPVFAYEMSLAIWLIGRGRFRRGLE